MSRANPHDQSPSHSARVSQENISKRGQACDRCRSRKVKCDGNVPSCANCASAGLVCEVSAVLQRNRKVRGFTGISDTSSQPQEELVRLRQLLENERKTSRNLRAALAEKARTNQQTDFETARQTTALRKTDTAYVIKHMGCMVEDEHGIGRFAGITTGAHAFQTLEKVFEACYKTGLPFPKTCYGLFLAVPTTDLALCESLDGYRSSSITAGPLHLEETRSFLQHPMSVFIQHFNMFIEQWEAICPIVIAHDLAEDLRPIVQMAQSGAVAFETDHSTLMAVVTIFAINQLQRTGSNEVQATKHGPSFIVMASRLAPLAMLQRSMKSLQALSLFAFWHQLTGQVARVADLNGVLVRMAQSLGLHRHSRRFKLTAGYNEHRKRLFWWVHSFDKISAVLLGLPPLINDDNVDTEMPSDCVVESIECVELDYPLPGDETSIVFFNQYIALMKILALALKQLYTTKDRYGGAEKITQLDREIQAWTHAFNSVQGESMFEVGQRSSSLQPSDELQATPLVVYWLKVLANMVSLFVHRPGLTFDSHTPEFSECLMKCIRASDVLLDLFDRDKIPCMLRNMCPLGPGLTMQCVSMHVYQHCILQTTATVAKSPQTPVTDTLLAAMNIFRYDLEQELSVSRASMTPNFYTRSLTDTMTLMQFFDSNIKQSHEPTGVQASNNPTPDLEGVSQFPQEMTPFNYDMLDNLNYMYTQQWMTPDVQLPFDDTF